MIEQCNPFRRFLAFQMEYDSYPVDNQPINSIRANVFNFPTFYSLVGGLPCCFDHNCSPERNP